MFKLIRKLFWLLTAQQRRELYFLQVLVVVMSLVEIIAIAAIAPFMSMIGDISVLEKNGILRDVYQFSGIDDPLQFGFLFGVMLLLILLVSALISMFTVWRLSLFATKTGTEIADSLFAYYMRKDWLFHANSSSAQLTKQIANETQRVTNGVIQPLMQMNARVVLIFAMSTAIFIYNPQVALSGLAIFTVAYLFLYKTVRKRLHLNGSNVSKVLSLRYKLMNEGFGGIKDTLLMGRGQDFIDRFELSGKSLAYSQGTNTALTQVPRYFMELIAFGSIIGLVLYLFKFYEGDLGAILPVLSIYALAGFKLLPAFQQVYVSIASIKASLPAFEAIEADLAEAKRASSTLYDNNLSGNKWSPHQKIVLSDAQFSYPGKNTPVLNGLSLTIPVNKVVGIVGSSGSGKSTAIDCILGLIQPDKGELKIDDEKVEPLGIRAWQNCIGFVSQSIFLTDGTIAENVAFGIADSAINRDQVKKALRLAHLLEFVDQLENGIETKVGERGVQLSGGQRQRIGIARALYHEAEILIFDEATSALDGITEKIIMDAINDFHGTKTIIMIAHRLKTLRNCDIIYMIESGSVIDQGSYDFLLENNPMFKKMSQNQ